MRAESRAEFRDPPFPPLYTTKLELPGMARVIPIRKRNVNQIG